MYLIAQASYQVNIRIVECLFHAHIRLLLAKDRQELVNITNRFHRLLTWAWFVWGLRPSLLWWLWCLLLLPASWAFNITVNYVGRSARCSLKSAPSTPRQKKTHILAIWRFSWKRQLVRVKMVPSCLEGWSWFGQQAAAQLPRAVFVQQGVAFSKADNF